MTYTSDTSPDAARHNQIDQRLGGILEFDHRNNYDEGEAALSFGSDSADDIEIDIDGANLLIGGSKVSAPPNTVPLSTEHDEWRVDHIYSDEDGAWSSHEGEPGSNEFIVHQVADSDLVDDDPDDIVEDNYEEGDVVHRVRLSERADGPAPKGTAFDGVQGELVFSVAIPPDATSASDLDERHIWDRRRVAIDQLDTDRPRQGGISTNAFELEPGEWEMWQLPAWIDHTLRVWDYALSMLDIGYFDQEDVEFTQIYLVDYVEIEDDVDDRELDWNDGEPDWSEIAVWESDETRHSPGDSPIVDIDLSGEVDQHAFVVENTHDSFEFTGSSGLTFTATYTLEATEDL